MGWFIAAAGLFTAVCSAMDFDWFMNHPKARLLVKVLGRNVTRVIYLVMGLMLLGLGIAGVMGVIDMGRS